MNSINTTQPTSATLSGLAEQAGAEPAGGARANGIRPKEGGYSTFETFDGLVDFNDPNFWANANTANLMGFFGHGYELVETPNGNGYNVLDVQADGFVTVEVADGNPDVMTVTPLEIDKQPSTELRPPTDTQQDSSSGSSIGSWVDNVPMGGQPWGAGDFNVPGRNETHTVVPSESLASVDPNREVSGEIGVWKDGAFRDRDGKVMESGFVSYPDKGDGQKVTDHVWGTQHNVTADPAANKVYHLTDSKLPDVVLNAQGVPTLAEFGTVPAAQRWPEVAPRLGSTIGTAAAGVENAVKSFTAAQQGMDKVLQGQGGVGAVLGNLNAASGQAKQVADQTQSLYDDLAKAGVITTAQHQEATQQIGAARQGIAQIDTELGQVGATFNTAVAGGSTPQQAASAIWDSMASKFGQIGSTLNTQLVNGQTASQGMGQNLKGVVDSHTQQAVAAAPPVQDTGSAVQVPAVASTQTSNWTVDPAVPSVWDALAAQDGAPQTTPTAAVVGLYFAAPEYKGAPDLPVVHDNLSTSLLGVVGYGVGAGTLISGFASATWQGLKATVLPTNMGQTVAAVGSAIYSGASSVVSDNILQLLDGKAPTNALPDAKDVPGMVMSAMTGTALAKIGPLFNIVDESGKVVGQYTEALVATRGMSWAGAIEAAQFIMKGDASGLVSVSAGVGGAYITQAGPLVAAAVNGPGNVATRFAGGLSAALPYIAPGAAMTGLAKATTLMDGTAAGQAVDGALNGR